jgi:hypothetical protein
VNFYPEEISTTQWAVVLPSTNPLKSKSPTPYLGRHHHDLSGEFIANGLVFATSAVHLPDFHCPSHQCKYYGPTGPV